MPPEPPDTRRPYTDRCPQCLDHALNPVRFTQTGGEMVCRYSCPCGHGWTTRWSVGCVEGWGKTTGVERRPAVDQDAS